MLRIQLLFSTTALFVRIELLYSSIRRLPPNRAYGVAVSEGSPIRYNIAVFHSDDQPGYYKKTKRNGTEDNVIL